MKKFKSIKRKNSKREGHTLMTLLKQQDTECKTFLSKLMDKSQRSQTQIQAQSVESVYSHGLLIPNS